MKSQTNKSNKKLIIWAIVALILGVIIGLILTSVTTGKADAATGGCNCLGTSCVCGSGTTCDAPGDNNVTLHGTCIENPQKKSWWNTKLW